MAVYTFVYLHRRNLAHVRFGQKQTYAAQTGMSASPPKADSCSALARVRFGPKADIRLCGHSLLFSTDRAVAGATEVYRNFVDLAGEFERRLVGVIHCRANVLADVEPFADRDLARNGFRHLA